MAPFLRQGDQAVDEENPPYLEETCFPKLIDPFSPSLAVQMRSYQRQKQKKFPSSGETSETPSQSIQERASDEENVLENDSSAKRLSKGSARAPSPRHQDCGEAPVEYDRGRRPDKTQYLPPSRRYRSGSRPAESSGAYHDTNTIQSASQVGQNENGPSTPKKAYATSLISASPSSTPPNSRPSSVALQSSPFTFQDAVPSKCFLPQHKETPHFPFSKPISNEEPLKLRIYVLVVRIILPQIYLHCLLRVPYLYLSRVHEIFQDSSITLKDFENLTLMDGIADREKGNVSDISESSKQSYVRMKANWEMFIDGLMREWKTFNIISGLLLSGILSIFQAEGANAEPITRYAALCSLVSALVSLIYGCFFIIRFGSMRRVSRGVEWAFTSCSDQSLIWNVYVMLALPIIWLIWSIVSFMIAIMAFMWRVRPGHDIPSVSENWELTFRLFVCLILGLGMAYAVLIISTLRHYGAEMDKAWNHRMREFWNRRPCDHGSRGKRLPRRNSGPMPYVIPPTPSPTLSATKAHALERLEVFPASTSLPQTFSSPTLAAASPSSKKRYFPTKIPKLQIRFRSSTDDHSTSPVVVPPTPTHSQSSANSDVDIPLNPNHCTSSVNRSPIVAALPLLAAQNFPLISENTNERIAPSFSRRYKVSPSSNDRGSWSVSPPITDMQDDAGLHASRDAVVATDLCPTSKGPAAQPSPNVDLELSSQVNSVGDQTGEQAPPSTVDRNQVEPRTFSHMLVSRPPNVHRPTSETILESRREAHRREIDPGPSSHPEPHIPRPPYIHRPTSETISEFRRAEHRACLDVGGDTCPEWQLPSHTPLSQPSNAHWPTPDAIMEVRREEYGTETNASGYSRFAPDVSNRVPLSQTLSDHQPTSDVISEVRLEEPGTDVDTGREGKTRNNWKNALHWPKEKVLNLSGRK